MIFLQENIEESYNLGTNNGFLKEDIKYSNHKKERLKILTPITLKTFAIKSKRIKMKATKRRNWQYVHSAKTCVNDILLTPKNSVVKRKGQTGL
jgi:hypothetical protein